MIKVVEPYALIQPMYGIDVATLGILMLKKIEKHARVSHDSEYLQTDTSYDRFLRQVIMERGDLSVLEHVTLSVETEVSRGITAEWERHRLGTYVEGAFTEASTRFINFTKANHEPKFILPLAVAANADAAEDWARTVAADVETYKRQIARGLRPQDARGVWPLDLASRMDVTYNLRQWRHLFLMRTSIETHPEFRRVTIPLLAEFQQNIPILFEDIEPNKRQADNVRLPH